MTAHQLLVKKVTTLTPLLAPGEWHTVATFDWRTPSAMVGKLDTSLSAARQLAELTSLKASKFVTVDGYTNLQANFAAGVCSATWHTRWVRIGTTNDTGLQSQPAAVPPPQAGAAVPTHFAYPHWSGVNPGGLRLEVRHLPGFFDSFKIATRYIKVEWHT